MHAVVGLTIKTEFKEGSSVALFIFSDKTRKLDDGNCKIGMQRVSYMGKILLQDHLYNWAILIDLIEYVQEQSS